MGVVQFVTGKRVLLYIDIIISLFISIAHKSVISMIIYICVSKINIEDYLQLVFTISIIVFHIIK